MVDPREAYAACERVARLHAENFPVASILLPRRARRHVAAVYAFARSADDFADEGDLDEDARRRLLEGWGVRLRAAARGRAAAPPAPGEPPQSPHIFDALADTIRRLALPVSLFEDLLDAFRQDVVVRRYATWDEVLDYCRRSANPIGRLLLRIAGYADDRLDRQSDALCTALQLTNFWQDLGVDLTRGRLYLPQEELERAGARIEDLPPPPLPREWRQALAGAVRRTRESFDRGRPLCNELRGRFRYELRATWLGGVRVLDRLERQGFDPLAARPRLRSTDAPWLAWKMVSWR